MSENNKITESADERIPVARPPSRRICALVAGAALTAIPVAGLYLYVRVERASNARDRAMERETDYDTAKLQQFDPALLRYHEVSRIETGIASGRAIAIDRSGTLLLAGDRIVRFILPGGDRRDWSLSASPNAVFAAGDGSVYIAMKDHVEVFGIDGARKAVWPALGDGAYLTGIAIAGEHVYLADSGRRAIIHTDLAGHVLNEIGRADPSRGIPGLLLPSPYLGVAIAADAGIWVNNAGRHRLENYAPDGTLERFWGTSGTSIGAFSGCCNPAAFSLLKDGSFITAEKGIPRVTHYLDDGRFDSVVAVPSSFAEGTSSLSLAIDPVGRVWVLERGTGTVHVFAPIGGGAT